MRLPLDIQPGLIGDDTSYSIPGTWRTGSNVRFWRGKAQTVGGWEKVVSSALSGTCRNLLPWTDNDGALNIGAGTHTHLQVHYDGEIYDITPTLNRPASDLGSDPFAVTDGSATVTVTHTTHGLATGDDVAFSGAVAVGRITITGTYEVTVTDANTYTITHGSNADTVKTLGNNPLSVTNGSPLVTVTETAHGIATGTSVTFAGATAVGGITPNGAFAITVVDADSYTFTFGSNATSTATGGGASVTATVPSTGGGSAVVAAPQEAFETGSEDGTGGAGYGTGTWDTGTYSSPSTADYWPRTWSLSPLGQNLIASPRRGAIYQWTNDTGTPAAPVKNSPRQVEFSLVGPHGEIFAFGCNEEASGTFNPLCIRHSGLRDAISPMETVWNTDTDTTAREYLLEGGGRIVGARLVGDLLLVWTDNGLHLGQYVGSPEQVWRFDQVGKECGLLGPNAAIVVGQSAYWLAPDLQFRRYDLGGAVDLVACPIKTDTVEQIAASQGDKVTASHIARFGEIRFDYPHEDDGTENSRYVSVSLEDGTWSQGEMARSAFASAGPAPYPIGADPDGYIYWHEKGNSADGGSLSGYLESNDLYLDENRTLLLRGLWPDVADQIGPLNFTAYSRLKPQGDERSQGPQAMAVGEDKVDLRLSGRLFRFRVDFDSAPAYARLGRLSVDVAAGGGR